MSFPRVALFLCQYQAPYAGSFIPALRALEEKLKGRGTRCIWVFPEDAGERPWCAALEDGGHRIEFLPGGSLRQLRRMNDLIRGERVDLIHAHFGYFTLASLLALLHRRLRVLEHVHSDFSAGEKPSVKRRLVRVARRFIQSRRVGRIMVGAHMLPHEKNAAYVPNGVDFSRMEDSRLSREEMRNSLGVGDGQTLVLLFGWSPYIKGVDIAARAMAHLQGEAFVLGVVCGREVPGEEMKLWLQERTLPIDSIRFLPPVENVFDYHRAADVMLSASRSETFSYAVAEALYACVPCVLSDIPGTRWAAAYETARVFPSGDDAALAEALQKAAAGYPADAYQRSRERVIKDCALERWVDGVITVYGLSQEPLSGDLLGSID